MHAQFAPHAQMRFRLARLLDDAASGLALSVIDDVTVQLGAFLPVPDIVVFAGETPRGPLVAEAVRLIVEIAQTTAADDLGPKRDLYAASGLAEYWVVDMTGGAILQFADPKDGLFQHASLLRRGEAAAALTIPGLLIETSGLPWN